MDKKTVFVKTTKGRGEVANQTDFLYGDAKRVLLLVDDDSTVGDITKRAPPSLRTTLEKELQDLLNGGFIRDNKAPEDEPQKQSLKFATPKFATPKAAAARFEPPRYEAPKAAAPQAAAPRVEAPKVAPPAPASAPQPDQEMELDFSFLTSTAPPKPASPPPTTAVTNEAAKPTARVEPAVKPQSEAELARVKAVQLAQIEATAAAAKAKAYAEAKAKAKAEVEIRARAEAEARAKQAAEAARLKAEQEAVQARAELEAAKAKADAELRARAVAAARIKQEAEAARLKAEQEAARARAELEAAKAKMEAEIRSRVEAEARAKQEAEAARLRAEQEAERVRAELEAARIKAEAEARARVESEARVKAEIEARLKLEAEEARLKAEREIAEVRAKLDAEKAKEEAEAKARAEAEVRIKAEVDARIKRETEEARLKVEREEAEARLKMAAEARIRAEVEAQILREEEDARLQAAKLLVEMDAIKAKAEADAKALVDAAARIKAEADARQKQEEEAARLKAEKERADALMDPAEKIRLSFAQSAAASQGKQGAGAPAFKFDSFALGGVDRAAAATIPPHKLPAGGAPVPVINLGNLDGVADVPARETAAPAAGGSKVKAAIEQRAQKEAEAQRIKAEQEAAARLKSEQEAAARLKAEQEAARIAAAEESARLKAEHEAYRAKVEQEEARSKAEQEARKQADEQGKAWEEAEQRAKAKAQAEKERLERQQTEAQSKAVSKPPKARRKPLPLGKFAGALLVMAVLAVVVLPYVWPLESYVQPIEQELSEHLRQPVHIGKITAALLPSPRLELADVSVGGGSELKIRNVVVNFDFSALFSPTRSINQLQLNEMSLKGNALPAAMTWFKSAGGIEKYPVARMELHNVRVESEEIKLPLVSGHAEFNAQGAFTKAEMKSADSRFGFELEPVQKHLQLVVNFKDGNLPLLPGIPFTDLSATGEVLNGEIVFSDIYAHLYGGMLGGNARLNWQNGWLLQGRLIAKSLELKSLFPRFGITGELYGDVNVTMSGAKLAQLGDAPRMEGTFEAKKVDINKIDIETIARFGNRSDLGRGHTSFDEIKGNLQADSQGQRLRQLELSSGVLNATGTMDVASGQQISGKLSVDLKGMRGGNVAFLLSGTPADPVVKAR